ncbi:nucleotidyl transferase AbiEii/AbiGii toxin family protein [Steroidobacter cummioxidans]|uniref:nucleotidyl transferase AbiEii/AbiGii toxin family protein n=1 Tax=Steroidobacter cummioxidans TaxID=1803913 RepID=UPI000E323EDC|nr:nucleotidyl transferase AbiEii/AbiGii toxin family protein [Steroidobacter cummioxidans]
MNQVYLDTARLLTQVAPVVLSTDAFALKGGTAINLFIRDMPRLSVDLDLALIDHTLSREAALKCISDSLGASAKALQRLGFNTRTVCVANTPDTKLLARRQNIEIKVEVNFVLRGLVGPVSTRALTQQAQDSLQAEIEVPVASNEDVYASKLVAALDRQHPRDLFDVMQLFEHGGITPAIRRAFIIYLASHDRPLHEVLAPTRRDLTLDYVGAFNGMTAKAVPLDQLLAVRERLVAELHRDLDETERRFLLSFVNLAPEWALLDIPHAVDLPGLRWKIANLERLREKNPAKFARQANALATVLEK